MHACLDHNYVLVCVCSFKTTAKTEQTQKGEEIYFLLLKSCNHVVKKKRKKAALICMNNAFV